MATAARILISDSPVPLVPLRAPLLVKLVGANLFAVVVLGLVWLAHPDTAVTPRLLAGVAVLLVVHFTLLIVALRPVRDLEKVAARVWHGDYGARVETSAVADQRTLRVGAMFNLLLDGLAADRARMRALADEVIQISDRERAALARELHDSTAQRLAALLFELSAAARDCNDPALRERLFMARDTAQELTDEVRRLAQTVHPRVNGLGLVAALRKLARDYSRGTGVDIDVAAPRSADDIPHRIAAVLYRVAQEAVRNAVTHAAAHRVQVTLHVGREDAAVEIHDDGSGFDLADAEQRRPGMGLFTMRERVALVDGRFGLHTAPGNGTTVVATVPFNSPAVHRAATSPTRVGAGT